MNNVITIDGPSGAGKGTIAKLVAAKLGYQYLDTGALYRAVAWKARDAAIDIDDEQALGKLTAEIDISFENGRVAVDGKDVSQDIRTGEIGELSSRVSAKPAVRKGLFHVQRNMCLKGKIVIEGRDTGTAIFPEAPYKFFLDATIEERARRRYIDLKEQDPDITLEQTVEDIRKRDDRDSTRKTSPLKKTDDMIHIDSTGLTIDEVAAGILNCIK
jgi:cytidylate kinase